MTIGPVSPSIRSALAGAGHQHHRLGGVQRGGGGKVGAGDDLVKTASAHQAGGEVVPIGVVGRTICCY